MVNSQAEREEESVADNVKQSLSAWLDGEASEIEVHRLLRQVEQDAGLKNDWLAYQQIRSVIRQEQQFSTRAHLELHDRIKAAIEAEPPFVDEIGMQQHSAAAKLYKPVAGLAVAASLVAAIFLGVQTTQMADSGTSDQGSPELTAQAPEITAQSPEFVAQAPRLAAQTDAELTPAGNDSEPFGDESELRELDEDGKKFFRTYVMRHDRLSKMNPYARVSNKQK